MGEPLDWWRGARRKMRTGHCNCCSSYGKTKDRRRNRARHVELARAEATRELAAPHHQSLAERLAETRPFDMNDDNACLSNEVWRALCEDQYGLASLADFTGVYTTESERGKVEIVNRRKA